jgi:hypothetical protein
MLVSPHVEALFELTEVSLVMSRSSRIFSSCESSLRIEPRALQFDEARFSGK